MKYKIMLCNLINGEFEFNDFTCFINKHGLLRLEYNMANKWAWNNLELQRTNNDGECCYIEWMA